MVAESMVSAQQKDDASVTFVDAALGRGHGLSSQRLEEINGQLRVDFAALYKNTLGNIDKGAMRFLAQNYFAREHGWLLHGLEHHRSDAAVDHNEGLLAQKVSSFVNTTYHTWGGRGFSIVDAADLIAVLEALIAEESISTLHAAYQLHGFDTHQLLSEDDTLLVLDSYMVLFVMGNRRDPRNTSQHMLDLESIHDVFPMWEQTQIFEDDVLRSLTFAWGCRRNPFTPPVFSFEEAGHTVALMGRDYGKFQDFECKDMKAALVRMDPASTGRVPLGRFYAKRADAYQFRETPEYLRQLGALDESLLGSGPQVLIANYIAGMSNCIASSQFYSVCCLSECDSLLNFLQGHVAAPVATPKAIMELVQRYDLSARNISSALVGALEQVASVHHGEVPLHSRLFLQWLHYMFPQECPYPHVLGSIAPMMPMAYRTKTGAPSRAADKTMKRYIDLSASVSNLQGDSQGRANNFMSAWTSEEQLLDVALITASGRISVVVDVVQVLVLGFVVLRFFRVVLCHRAFRDLSKQHAV